MKYRIKYNHSRGRWLLQTPPTTSSAWDEIAELRWQWPLYLYARLHAIGRGRRERLKAKREVIRDFKL